MLQPSQYNDAGRRVIVHPAAHRATAVAIAHCSQLSQSALSCGGGRAGWGRENAAGIFLDVIIQGLDNAPNQPLSPSVIEFLQ